MPIEDKVTRKLRAILSADVKGYSLLMSDDEIHTIQTLKTYRQIISDYVKQHTGRVVDSPGDNILAEFGSAIDAVQCAVDIQKQLKKENERFVKDKKLQFRIGVNIGDVVQDGNRIYGNGVNVAARIEGLAEPGGVSISRNAYDHIRDKMELGYEYLGEHSVKNIKHPVRVYKVLLDSEDAGKLIGDVPKPVTKKWVWATAVLAVIVITSVVWQVYQKMAEPEFEPASVEKMALQLSDKPSIAVLPFNNFSKDPEQDYIADGITENIITTLSKLDKMFVIARNSVFTYKGKPVAIRQVSEDLGVRYVLEGSVQISENRIRITAQLIDAIKGTHIWAQKYDKNMDDIFQLQDDIALKVLESMRVELTEGEQAILIGGDTKNLDAYLYFLKGQEQVDKFTKEGNMLARKAVLAAIEIDPMFSSAYRTLAFTHLSDVWFGVSKDPKLSIKKAFKLLEKVRLLDENSPGYYFIMSQLLLLTRQHDKAIKSAERAVSLDPNNATFLQGLAIILRYIGEPERALNLQKKVMRLNPYPASMSYTNLGFIYLSNDKFEEAIQAFKKATQTSPNQVLNHYGLVVAYSELDLNEKARAAMSETLALKPQLSIEWTKTLPYRDKTDLDRVVARLEKAGFPKHPPLPLPDKPSIAVLAFDNLSGDPEQEYFSDGIAENIITALSKVGELFVIARNSSFTYKGKPVKIQQVSRELGVRYVLEGSVQKSGERVRITAQLIDARNGQHLWAENYDRDFRDIFEIQDEITMKIVTALRIKLTEGAQVRIWAKKVNNLNVFLKLTQTYSLWNKGTKESLIRYGQIAQEIIAMDPESPVGYRVLGWYHYGLSNYGDSPKENLKKAFMLGQKVLAMDESDGWSHALVGYIYLKMRKYEEAIESGKRSIELQPNGAFFHVLLGATLNDAGLVDEGITHVKQAIRLNPFPVYYYYYHLGRCYLQKGQYEDALTEFKKALQRAPEAPQNHGNLAITYILLDRNEEARASTAKMLELAPWVSVSLLSKTSSVKNQDYLKLFIDAMRKAGFPE